VFKNLNLIEHYDIDLFLIVFILFIKNETKYHIFTRARARALKKIVITILL